MRDTIRRAVTVMLPDMSVDFDADALDGLPDVDVRTNATLFSIVKNGERHGRWAWIEPEWDDGDTIGFMVAFDVERGVWSHESFQRITKKMVAIARAKLN